MSEPVRSPVETETPLRLGYTGVDKSLILVYNIYILRGGGQMNHLETLEKSIEELIENVYEFARPGRDGSGSSDSRRIVAIEEDLVKSIRNTYNNNPTAATAEVLDKLIGNYITQIQSEWG